MDQFFFLRIPSLKPGFGKIRDMEIKFPGDMKSSKRLKAYLVPVLGKGIYTMLLLWSDVLTWSEFGPFIRKWSGFALNSAYLV